MNSKDIIDQLRFRYYSPKHFEGIVVTDFDKFDLYQKLNISYLEGKKSITFENHSIHLNGDQDQLQNVLLYQDTNLIGGLSLEFNSSIANEIWAYQLKYYQTKSPTEFLNLVLTGKYCQDFTESNGIKILVGNCDLIRYALHDIRARPPAYILFKFDFL